jgi:hypothetical protein
VLIPGSIPKPSDHPLFIHRQLIYLGLESMGPEDVSWLTGLSFPNLETLAITDGFLTPESIAFIQCHRSIKNLECKLFKGDSRTLELAAPQLTYLTIQYPVSFGKKFHLFSEFQQLHSLKIRDEDGYLSLDEFDTIVKKRCLPSSHDQSQLSADLQSPLKFLKIVGRSPRRRPLSPSTGIIPWRESSLIKDATRNETERSNKWLLSWL